MIHLAWPWALLLLPLPWLVRRLAPPARAPRALALRTPLFERLAGGAAAAAPTRDLRGRLRLGMAVAAWLLLVAAAARPQWLGEPLELPLTGRDLMLAVDVSESMQVEDMELEGRAVDRLTVVQEVAGDFIRRRTGDRLGLILFASQAYVQTPLTFDRTTVAAMLQEAAIGLAGKKTAIGDAIGLAVKRMGNEADDEDRGPRVLILLSDGANTAGAVEPRQAADLAARRGLRIHTVGIGAERLRVGSIFGSRVVNPSADLDEAMLKDVAAATGGRYFRATDTDALEEVYRLLDELEPAVRDARLFRPLSALYPWPLAVALLLAAGLLVDGLRRPGTPQVAP